MPKLPWYEDPKVFREKRKELGITQHALAKLAQVKRSLISDIEAGRRSLSGDVRDTLWATLGEVRIQRLKGTPEWEKMLEKARKKREEERKKSGGYSLLNALSTPSSPMILTPGLMEKLGEIKAQEKQIIIQEREIAALRGQVEAQAEQIAALRDLLDLKTKEVLLRDKIESDQMATAAVKKETAPKDGDD